MTQTRHERYDEFEDQLPTDPVEFQKLQQKILLDLPASHTARLITEHEASIETACRALAAMLNKALRASRNGKQPSHVDTRMMADLANSIMASTHHLKFLRRTHRKLTKKRRDPIRAFRTNQGTIPDINRKKGKP